MLQSIKNLKYLFVPREAGQAPVLLTPLSSLILLMLALAMIAPPVYQQNQHIAQLVAPASFNAEDIIFLLNIARGEAGLSPLQTSDLLLKAAEEKAEDMIGAGYFAHASPDGRSPWDFIRGAGYEYSAAGENLAVDFSSAEGAHSALMNSPSHRMNILNNLYTEVGVAVLQGKYNNRKSIFVVQHFGNPVPDAPKKAKAILGKNNEDNKKEAVLLEEGSVPVENVKSDVVPAVNSSMPSGIVETRVLPFISEFTPRQFQEVKLADAEVPVINSMRFVSFLIVSLILFAISFLLIRTRRMTLDLASRSLILIIIFGYIGLFGVPYEHKPNITPASVFVILSQGLESD